VQFTADGGTNQVTTAGKILGGLTVNAPGATVQLMDGLTIAGLGRAAGPDLFSGTLTLTAGTLDFNGQNVSAGAFASTGTGTRTLTPGSGSHSLTGVTGLLWDTSTNTNLTISSNTATFTLKGNVQPTGNRSVATGTSTANMPAIVVESIPYLSMVVLTAVTTTIPSLTIGSNIWLQIGTTTTISGALTVTGEQQKLSIIASDSAGTSRTFTIGSGSLAWVAVRDISFSTSVSAANSLSMNGNSNFTASSNPTYASAGGGGAYVIGG